MEDGRLPDGEAPIAMSVGVYKKCVSDEVNTSACKMSAVPMARLPIRQRDPPEVDE